MERTSKVHQMQGKSNFLMFKILKLNFQQQVLCLEFIKIEVMYNEII